VWITVQCWLTFRALRGQVAEPDPIPTPASTLSPTP